MLNQIQQLIARGRTEQALEHLHQLTAQDSHLSSQAILLQSSYQELKKKQNMGLIPNSEANMELARINLAAIELSKQIQAHSVQLPPSPPPPTTSPPLIKEPGLGDSGSSPKNSIPWLVGLGMLFLITGILLFVPCPTETQFFAFRLILAFAAAILASQLPGMFQFELQPFLTAGGALAVFGALFFMNPAKLVGEGKCASGPFEFTAQIKVNPALNVPSTYPKLEDARLELWLDNYWKPNDALNNGVADFKTIPADKRDVKVPAQLKARYWKLSSDSIALLGKSQIIYIEPDGSLAKIEGKVMDSKTGNPIEGALVETMQLTVPTDAQGNFTLQIPLEEQRDEYEVYVNKTGFGAWKGSATPATGAALSVILSKQK